MSLTFDQKNINILDRFESQKLGSKVRKFVFKLDGKPMSMLNMQDCSLDDAIKSLKVRWGNRVSDVKEQ